MTLPIGCRTSVSTGDGIQEEELGKEEKTFVKKLNDWSNFTKNEMGNMNVIKCKPGRYHIETSPYQKETTIQPMEHFTQQQEPLPSETTLQAIRTMARMYRLMSDKKRKLYYTN